MEHDVPKGDWSIRNILGNIFMFLSFAVLGIGGVWGIKLIIPIITQISSSILFYAVALVLAPITCVAAPLYALFKWGEWLPAIVIFGGCLLWWGLAAIGSLIKGE